MVAKLIVISDYFLTLPECEHALTITIRVMGAAHSDIKICQNAFPDASLPLTVAAYIIADQTYRTRRHGWGAQWYRALPAPVSPAKALLPECRLSPVKSAGRGSSARQTVNTHEDRSN